MSDIEGHQKKMTSKKKKHVLKGSFKGIFKIIFYKHPLNLSTRYFKCLKNTFKKSSKFGRKIDNLRIKEKQLAS